MWFIKKILKKCRLCIKLVTLKNKNLRISTLAKNSLKITYTTSSKSLFMVLSSKNTMLHMMSTENQCQCNKLQKCRLSSLPYLQIANKMALSITGASTDATMREVCAPRWKKTDSNFSKVSSSKHLYLPHVQ